MYLGAIALDVSHIWKLKLLLAFSPSWFTWHTTKWLKKRPIYHWWVFLWPHFLI